MAELLMNRCRSLAEGVVVMICPVFLALTLNKVDLNGEVYGYGVPIAMLTIAGVTLISGIFPLLACCFPEKFPGASYVKPAIVTASLATLSTSFFLLLAGLIALRIVSKSMAITVVVLFGACVVARTFCYYRTQNDGKKYSAAMHNILDESHEFLTGVTGILFLGLEGLALEGHNNQQVVSSYKGGSMGTISFIVCAIGVCLMFLEMVPPLNFDTEKKIVGFTLVLDGIMAAGTFTLLMAVMLKLVRYGALALFLPPAAIIGVIVYRIAVSRNVVDGGNQEPRPASLELTRVTFTGFLAVSVTATSKDSPRCMLTAWFLLLAAAAIVFSLSWRLLSQLHMRNLLEGHANHLDVASIANLASFGAHFCIVVATILFLGMAGKAIGK